ncbi:MAG: YfhO family protein [candidate division WOR-3 bacterium]|nr:YfhO family protein [candidate division WOR-3 bacterium]
MKGNLKSKKKPETKKPFIKKPWRLIILLFILLPIIYFSQFLSSQRMLAGSDWLQGSFPSWQFMAQHIKNTGDLAFWHPHIFGGLPTVAAFFGDLFSPATLFRLFISPHLVFVYVFIAFIFVAGISTYYYLKELNIETYPAIIGGLIYMFAGSLVTTTYAGHAGRLGSAAFFPLILFLIHRGLKQRRLIYFSLMGVVFAFCFLACHFQLTYYAVIASGFYFLIHLILERKENGLKNTMNLILFYLIGVLIMVFFVSIQYLPVYGNLPFAARGQEKGYAFAASWSLPPIEIFDLLIPNFSGILNNYWGENYFKLHSEYFGLLPLLICGIALLFRRKNRYVTYFVWLGIITLLFSFGGHTPLFRIFYYFPMISKFRAPSQAFYLVTFSLVALMAFGLSEVLRISNDKERLKKFRRYLFYCLIIGGVLTFLSFLAKDSLLSLFSGYIKQTNPVGAEGKIKNLFENYPSFQITFLRTLLILFIYSLLVWFLAKMKLKPHIFALFVGVILLFDQWSITKKFVKETVGPEEYYKSDEVVNFLMRDKDIYRVHPLHYERANDGILMYYDIQSAGGYHPNPIQTYQDFIGAEKSVMFHAPNLMYKNFLDLLNVKYIISVPLPEDITRYSQQEQMAILQFKQFFSQPDFELVFSGRKNVIYRNNTVLPRTFLVPKFEVIADKDAVLNRLKDNSFDPRQIIILNEAPVSIGNLSDSILGTVEITNYDPNRITIEATIQNPGFLVLSENHHPDWKALVDGKPAKIYRAYHTFRAIYLEPGSHTINFIYDSLYYRLGSTLSIIACVFLVIVLIWERRSKIKSQRSKVKGEVTKKPS